MPTDRKKPVQQTHDGAGSFLTDEEARTIIEMYQATTDSGEPRYTLADITQAVRRPRGTIYWALREAGIVPKRIRRTPQGAPTVEGLIADLAEERRVCAELRLELEREQSVNTRLMRLLAALEESEKTEKKGTKTSSQRGTRRRDV